MRTALLLLALGGCLRATEYHCTDDTACSGGTCEPSGFCSFADATCATGQRFGDSAGALSSTCVGSVTDGGVDATDALPGACPATYATIAGGQGTHVYRLLGQSESWETQRASCAADGAYLAIPDDAEELAALGNRVNGPPVYWVGITDAVTEGTFLNTKGAIQTFLPWGQGQPNDFQDSDCVTADRGEDTLNDTRCTQDYRALCECEP